MPITLSSRFARRTALAGAAATLSIALAACGASFDAPTLQPYQAAEGTNADSGSLKVRNMLVLADADGKGELHSVIVNDGAEPTTPWSSIAQAPPGTADGQAGGDQPGEVKFSELKPLDLKAGTPTLVPPDTADGGGDRRDTPSRSRPARSPASGQRDHHLRQRRADHRLHPGAPRVTTTRRPGG